MPSSDPRQRAHTARHTSLHLTRCPSSSPQARRWARTVLTDWSVPDDARDDLLLIVCELVTNAITHATGPIRAQLARDHAGSYHVHVDDGGPQPAPAGSAAHADEHGRGLAIVGHLAARHGHGRAPHPYRARSWATVTPHRTTTPTRPQPSRGAHAMTSAPCPSRLSHPSRSVNPPARTARPAPAPRTTTPGPIRVQRIQVDELTVTDPRQVLGHARRAARDEPYTAALLGYRPGTTLTLPAAAALLSALHDADDLTAMGLHITRQATRVAAAGTGTAPVTLELANAPADEE